MGVVVCLRSLFPRPPSLNSSNVGGEKSRFSSHIILERIEGGLGTIEGGLGTYEAMPKIQCSRLAP